MAAPRVEIPAHRPVYRYECRECGGPQEEWDGVCESCALRRAAQQLRARPVEQDPDHGWIEGARRAGSSRRVAEANAEKTCPCCERTLPKRDFHWCDTCSECRAASCYRVQVGRYDPARCRRDTQSRPVPVPAPPAEPPSDIATCRRCDEVRPLAEFETWRNRRTGASGYTRYCKPCARVVRRERYERYVARCREKRGLVQVERDLPVS